VRRARLDYESHVTGLDRSKVGALLVAAGLAGARDHALHGVGLMPGCAGQWRSTTVNVVRVLRLSPAGKQLLARSGAKPSQWGSVNVQ